MDGQTVVIEKLELKVAPKVQTRTDVLRRYPRITAHLICQSGGYFTPESAAGAILDTLYGCECWCELYMHYARFGKPLLEVQREDLQRVIAGRHYHTGYMANYRTARGLVAQVAAYGEPPQMLMSW